MLDDCHRGFRIAEAMSFAEDFYYNFREWVYSS